MRLRHLLPLLALLLAPACKSNDDHDSAIIVYVQSDLAIPTEIDRVRIKTSSAASQAPLHEYTYLLGQGAERVMLPVREGLYPTNDSQAAIRVEAQALLGELVVVTRTAVLSFAPGKKVVLDLSLLATCRARTCSPGLTCGPNGCQPETVDTGRLPVYQPGLTPLPAVVDGSVADGSAVDAGKDAPAASAEAGADASRDSELDRPDPTGTDTEINTGTGTGLPSTGTSAGQTGTVTAATGTGTSLLTGTGSNATATQTAASATQTSLATQLTATNTGLTTRTGTGSGSGSGNNTGTATKTGTVTMTGTRSVTSLFTSIASSTATLNVTVPSTATAIVTQTVTDTATAIGTASVTYSVTATSTAASTNTATSSAGAMAMTYLPLTKYDSLPAATDTSTSTLTAGGTAADQSGNFFCGTGDYRNRIACNAYIDNVAAGQASPFAPSSTRYQPGSGSSSRIYDCAWYPTPAGKLSISIWVKPSQLTGGKQSILAWNFGDVQLSIDANGNAACLPVGTSPVNTIPVPLNQWTHLTCTQNATTWKLYLNDGTTSVTNTGPTIFRNPQPDPTVVNCLGYWYLSGWDLTNTVDPCTASNTPAVRFAGDLSTLRIYHDYTLSPLEVANLHLCNNTACTGTIVVTSTATASVTTTVPITITATATATTVGTIPATTTDTATGTVSTIATSVGSTIETFLRTGTQTQAAHRLFGW